MKKQFQHLSQCQIRSTLGLGIILVVAAHGQVQAQPSVYAPGLQNPTKIILGPSGTLLVSEAGITPNSVRVNVIDPGGSHRTLIDGLPSGVATSGPDATGLPSPGGRSTWHAPKAMVS